MKTTIAAAAMLVSAVALADDADLADKIMTHQDGSRTLSDEQDELAADVQQLTIEQTDPKVIGMFLEVEEAMDEASELLYEHDTGGVTIAAETDVIEKIFEAAKQKQCKGGSASPGGAMLEMMGRMLGKEPGQKPGNKPGDKAGQGQTGESDTANEGVEGVAGGNVEERTVPKGSGTAGRSMPPEFRDALKAFNREATKLTK